jgi:hypothetical protein
MSLLLVKVCWIVKHRQLGKGNTSIAPQVVDSFVELSLIEPLMAVWAQRRNG